MLDSRVPTFLWPEAVAICVYLLNCLPTKILHLKTPLDYLSAITKIPSALSLQPCIFGCTVFVHIPKHERSKFSPCAEKCVFVGYGVNQKGYRCYNPKTRKIITSIHCDFLETEFFYSGHLHSQGESLDNGSKGDSLSWFFPKNPSVVSPTTSLPSETHSAQEQTQLEVSPQIDSLTPISPANESKLVESDETETDPSTDPPENVAETSSPIRYNLPPRSTRESLLEGPRQTK